jgi:SpoVK/Ycf46/Vps4 family AAA+-type ATPase
MHGVPGCGKTLLAKALCSELHEIFTFFNVSASTLISKWRGESEKLMRVLFELAKYQQPSIIFIDELDSLTSKRCAATEHEATKRLKNEFLSLLDGLESDASGKVFVLGSTNLPWFVLIFRNRRMMKISDFPSQGHRHRFSATIREKNPHRRANIQRALEPRQTLPARIAAVARRGAGRARIA